MDVQLIVTVASVGFGIGSFTMGALVSRTAIANLRAKIAEDRRKDADELKDWVERRFQRKPA